MKSILRGALALVLLFVLTACGRDLGLTTADGTYLQMKIQVPETGSSDSSRLIHSESDELKITLTYPDETVISATFTRNEESVMVVDVEDLDPSAGVQIEVTMGIAAYNLVLTKASQTMEIAEGANTLSLTLEAYDQTVSGTLIDSSDQILANHTITVGSTDITTDASGNFTLTVNTEDLTDTMTFRVVNGDTYDFTRTHLALLQSWDDFSLKTAPEIYLDFIVGCELYPLPGINFTVYANGSTEVATGTSDSLGRILYQDSNYTTSSGSHEIVLDSTGMFISEIVTTPGAPGAYTTDIVLEPYVFFSDWRDESEYTISFYRTDGVGSREYIPMNPDFVSNSVNGSKNVIDYVNGKAYIWICSNVTDYSLIELIGWNSTTPNFTSHTITNPFLNSMYSDEISVQEMLLMDDGNLLIATSYGAFIFDTTTNTITDKWENPGDKAFVINGAYQTSNGSIYLLGVDRNGLTPAEQKIYQLMDDNLKPEIASLPSYNGFIASDATGDLNSGTYIYLLGAQQWGSKIVSVIPQLTTYSGTEGSIVIFDPSGSTWSQSGTPINEESTSDPFEYLVPIGILPDNKFYFLEKDTNYPESSSIFSLENSDNPVLNLFETFSNPSSSTNSILQYRYRGYSWGGA